MTPLRQRFIEDMQLRGYSARTQEAYTRAVRQLAERYRRSPDKLSEEQLRQYFLYLANEKKWARASTTIALCGIKFFYEQTLQRDWPTLRFFRPPREKKLPVILSREEVRRILAEVRIPVYRACLTTIYSCGLRLMEGARLQVADVDSARMVLHIHGKRETRPLRTLAGGDTPEAASVLEDPSFSSMALSGADTPRYDMECCSRRRPSDPHQLAERLLPRPEKNRHSQTRSRAYAASFLRYPLDGSGRSSPFDSRQSRARQSENHGDLYPSDQRGTSHTDQPAE